jgi:hypothetical protein
LVHHARLLLTVEPVLRKVLRSAKVAIAFIRTTFCNLFTFSTFGLGALHFNLILADSEETYHFAFNCERAMSHACFDSTVIVKSDESESSWSSGFFVHHEGCIENCSELFKVFLELFFDDILSNSADKDFRGAILFVSRYCAFWIDLG